jgi:hypothetical protein
MQCFVEALPTYMRTSPTGNTHSPMCIRILALLQLCEFDLPKIERIPFTLQRSLSSFANALEHHSQTHTRSAIVCYAIYRVRCGM